MIEIERKKFIFKKKEIWFADYPFDINGFDKVTFYDCKNMIGDKGFNCKEFTTLVIDLRQSLEDIWYNMGKSSCRYEINRAIKEGVKVKINQNFEDFIKIDKLFRKAKNLPKSNITIQFIKKYGILFIAELGNEIVGGQFYLKDKNNMRLLLAPSKRLEVDKKKSVLVGMGNRLMVWEAIKYAKENGVKEFDMGGCVPTTDNNSPAYGWYSFKKSFGGKLIIHYIYQKNYSKFYKFLSFLKQKFIINYIKI